MKLRNPIVPFILALAFVCLPLGGKAEQHRATRLGGVTTRFVAPLSSVEDLRAMFADKQLQSDSADILRQSGWPGRLADFFSAGLTNQISEYQIAVGEKMPFMSSREEGKPHCLRNVTWAGAQPVPAYTFVFSSNSRLYRCIVPKPCGNFFLEDLGPAPNPQLTISCDSPAKVVVGRKFKVSLNVHNSGNVGVASATVTLPVPAATEVVSASDGGAADGGVVTWQLADLSPDAAKQVVVVLKSTQPAPLNFNSTVASAAVAPAQCACATESIGIPAILLEKSDDPDPVSIGDTTTYTVRITNQGTGDDTNVQLVVLVAPQLLPVSSAEGAIDGQTVTLPLVPKLGPKEVLTYKIIAKGVSAGDGHTKFTLTSAMLTSPLSAEESTTVY